MAVCKRAVRAHCSLSVLSIVSLAKQQPAERRAGPAACTTFTLMEWWNNVYDCSDWQSVLHFMLSMSKFCNKRLLKMFLVKSVGYLKEKLSEKSLNHNEDKNYVLNFVCWLLPCLRPWSNYSTNLFVWGTEKIWDIEICIYSEIKSNVQDISLWNYYLSIILLSNYILYQFRSFLSKTQKWFKKIV